jgi:hypothetical protein
VNFFAQHVDPVKRLGLNIPPGAFADICFWGVNGIYGVRHWRVPYYYFWLYVTG